MFFMFSYFLFTTLPVLIQLISFCFPNLEELNISNNKNVLKHLKKYVNSGMFLKFFSDFLLFRIIIFGVGIDWTYVYLIQCKSRVCFHLVRGIWIKANILIKNVFAFILFSTLPVLITINLCCLPKLWLDFI